MVPLRLASCRPRLLGLAGGLGLPHHLRKVSGVANPSIERTFQRPFRALWATPQVERKASTVNLMARILHSINVTLNGSCHHEEVVADQEHHEYALRLLTSASGVLLGRNTFNLFESFWPHAATSNDLPQHTRDFALELQVKPKLVVSSTSVPTTWENTTSIKGPGLDELKSRVRGLPGTIVLFGSPSLASSLANAGLLAEIHLLVQPLLSGSTVRAYSGLQDCKQVEILGVDRFQSGVILLRYGVEA